jgi:hypothetical protein
MTENKEPKRIFFYHTDMCKNLASSNIPVDKPCVMLEIKPMPDGKSLKSIMKYQEKVKTFVYPKKDANTPEHLRKTRNIVHKLLNDGLNETKAYIKRERQKYCPKKQAEKLQEKIKESKKK